MRIQGWLVHIFLGLFAASAGFGQTPPPNDNYSNRIVLDGTDLTFSGTLAGGTLEDPRESSTYLSKFGVTPPSHSVWWSWTAPVSTDLTLQILSSSLDQFEIENRAALAVYHATNGSTSPSGLELPALAIRFFDFRLAPLTVSISVTAGTEYQIQLIGSSTATYTNRLVATNTPVIVEQPRSRTVYSNASAFFYVIAAGVNQSGLTFQWRFNGTNLDNETAPMLALTNIDTSVAGAYSVVVSNSAGFTLSEPATLAVSQSNVPISLAVVGTQSNSFSFSLTGENGRSYRVESSTNLTNWVPTLEFSKEPLSPNSTSVIFNTNSPLSLTVMNNSVAKYYRASAYAPAPAAADLCINHLEEIRVAKLLWQRDTVVSSTTTPTVTNITHYLPRQVAPFCPLDSAQAFTTSYSMQDLRTEPLCKILGTTHKIEEAR